MVSCQDLANAIACAYVRTAPGGVALFQPDFVTETFTPGTESGGSDADGRALRYLEWRWDPDPADSTYQTELVYLLRHADGTVRAVHDQHFMGLFPRAVWLELIADAGFQPRVVPFQHSSNCDGTHEVFLGLRSDAGEVSEA